MNQTERRILEVMVDGAPIEKIKMDVNSHTTKVSENGIIPTGEYSMHPGEIRNMVYRRLEREHPKRKIEIRLY